MGKRKPINEHDPSTNTPSRWPDTSGHVASPWTPEAVPGPRAGARKSTAIVSPPAEAGAHMKDAVAETKKTTPAPEGDCFEEIQEAIDRLAFLAWERWGEGVDVQPDDLRDALVDVRPIARELDGLWSHLRQTLGR